MKKDLVSLELSLLPLKQEADGREVRLVMRSTERALGIGFDLSR